MVYATAIAHADRTLAQTRSDEPSELGVFAFETYPALLRVFCGAGVGVRIGHGRVACAMVSRGFTHEQGEVEGKEAVA